MSLLEKEFCNTPNEYKLIFACVMNCVAMKKLFQTLLKCDELCCEEEIIPNTSSIA